MIKQVISFLQRNKLPGDERVTLKDVDRDSGGSDDPDHISSLPKYQLSFKASNETDPESGVEGSPDFCL